ncbi:MAG: glycosyltransferase family 1 protein [Treponemataceae bacterium]|nr:MAG: glycosyltransferase family 1 protein [Treponemataceae bacterium]
MMKMTRSKSTADKNKRMTIAIDCRHLHNSGIGVYLRGCLPYFLETEHDFLLFGDSAHIAEAAGGARGNVDIAECRVKPFSLNELFCFPRPLLKKINRAGVYYSPFFNVPGGITIPVCATIHDIIFPDMPELTSRTGLFARMRFFKRAAKRAAKIFTVSQFSKSRIEHYLGTSKPIVVAPGGIQSAFASYRAGPVLREKNQTIVFIGNIKKHKGLDCLLEAFIAARAEGLPHQLIIIGSRDNFRTADDSFLKKIDSSVSGAVTFTGALSDAALIDHVARASLLVQPSLYEGFGFPPLEAMFLGTRALVSDIPVFKEIYGGFPVVFFKAGDSGSLKEKLMELLYNAHTDCGTEFAGLSDELKNKYTFEKTAGIILDEIREFL